MKKPVVIIIVFLLVGTTIIGGVYLSSKWNQPLAEPLSLPTRTPNLEVVTKTAQLVSEDEKPGEVLPVGSSAKTFTPSPTEAQPVCGGPPLMYILGIGADNDYKYDYGLADVIRIARVDFVTPKITVLTLPRDLWVEIPDIIEKYADTVSHGKLNQAYLYGGPGMGYYAGVGGGPGLLARTLAHNYGLYIDHYGAVNMAVFVKIIDALGGIDIYLDQDWDGSPVDENTADMGYFSAGQHHMTGIQALKFSRIRKKYSEVARTDNQTLVLCAIKDKVLSPSVVGTIPKLINSLIGEIQTDLSPAEITQLACVLTKLEKENLQFIRFPDDMMVQGRVFDPHLNDTTFVWDIPKEDIQAIIRDFENDLILPNRDGGMTCP